MEKRDSRRKEVRRSPRATERAPKSTSRRLVQLQSTVCHALHALLSLLSPSSGSREQVVRPPSPSCSGWPGAGASSVPRKTALRAPLGSEGWNQTEPKAMCALRKSWTQSLERVRKISASALLWVRASPRVQREGDVLSVFFQAVSKLCLYACFIAV